MILQNKSFDVDLSGWSKTDANATVTWTRDTVTTHGGPGSSKFVNTAAGEDDNIGQFVTVLPGRRYTVGAWVFVSALTAPAIASRGLYMQSGGGAMETFAILDGSIPTGKWVLQTISGIIPAGQTALEIRLYAPQGTVFWDDVDPSSLGLAASIGGGGQGGGPGPRGGIARSIQPLVGGR